MSIPAAVAALDKEVEELDKKRARIVSLRDALLAEGAEGSNGVKSSVPAKKNKPGPNPGSARKSATVKRTGVAKKAVVAKKAAAPAKRILSPEARKKIADAQKKRWAATKEAAKKTA
jgi:hypothetical protein